MKRFICQLFVLVSLVFVAASCQKAPFLTLNTPRSFTFTRDGGSQSITFTCNRDWSVSSSESWIQVSPSSGTASDGEVTVRITCSANTTYDPRSATVTIKVEELTESVSISQDTGIGLIVSPKTLELTNAKQTIEIEVQKNVQYTVAIDNECAEWIKQGGTKALTTDKVTFTIEANTSYDNREGKITFKQLDGDLSETVVVRQSQTNGLFITTPDYSLSNEAHTLSVEVKANVEFDVTSQADWITYVETKALKASTITLSIPANEGYDSRNGTVLVKQKNGDLTGTITITQKQTDYLEVTPTSFDLDNQQHEIELKVTQNVAYSVVIPDDAKSWVYVPTKAATKGLVEDTVRLVVEANSTYDDRETSITIKQNDGSLAETVKIKQTMSEGLFVEKKEYIVSEDSQNLDIEVSANVEYEVLINADWIKKVETKGLTPSAVSLAIDANSATTSRTGSITIKQTSGDLSQTVTITQQPLPKIQTLDASDIGVLTACMNGRIIVESVEASAQEIFFRWSSTISNYEELVSSGKKVMANLKNDGAYNWVVEVNYNTTYYYVAGAKVNDRFYFGEMKSFTSKDLEKGVVDMGLSVKWRGSNVGASKPEEYGDYFAWGETETKNVYTWANYKWCDEGALNMLTKYNKDSSYGIVDNKPMLEADDDVAHVKLGNGWRIPTNKEWEELVINCQKYWTVFNGKLGILFTSDKNGNSIFLPAAGGRNGSDPMLVGEYCFYWTSDYWDFRAISTDYHGWTYDYRGNFRCHGLTVRPVMD